MRALLLLGLWCGVHAAAAAPPVFSQRDEVRAFIDGMAGRHGFVAADLAALLDQAEVSASILKAISVPAEAKPWFRYRPIFLQPDRVRQGVEFWRANEATLRRAADAYGVPEEIIVAIIGVETRYGRNAGGYRVLDALVTLAFEYPPRAAFFREELEQFLLLTRDHGLDPLTVKGSYAGAMGIPQFISSSYRRYAVDFDVDGVTDIWANPVDAIGSVANYFRSHGWRRGGPVVVPATVAAGREPPSSTGAAEPDLEAADLERLGVVAPLPLPPGERVRLVALEQESGRDYWLGYWNFHVITRYNRSALYAMAVWQLAGEIRAQMSESTATAGGPS
jgi:membrane-bound lytic murein transglycosylase B